MAGAVIKAEVRPAAVRRADSPLVQCRENVLRLSTEHVGRMLIQSGYLERTHVRTMGVAEKQECHITLGLGVEVKRSPGCVG